MKSRAMYEALRKELQGEAGRRLMELVDDTTYRIVTLPSDIGHKVADYVAQESLKGRRAADIAAEIKKMFPKKTTARAELIARTQTSMTSTNLTWQRAERLISLAHPDFREELIRSAEEQRIWLIRESHRIYRIIWAKFLRISVCNICGNGC